MATNEDVELELAQRVPEILRKSGISSKGYQCEAHLYREGERGYRKKHRDVEFERNWDPDTDYICISLWPVEEGEEIEPVIVKAATSFNDELKDERLSDLVRALDRAERRPGYEFVSLKWFRDTAWLMKASLGPRKRWPGTTFCGKRSIDDGFSRTRSQIRDHRIFR